MKFTGMLALLLPALSMAEGSWNIPVSAQIRVFPNVPQFQGQSYNTSSIALKPRYQNQEWRIEPFYRWDEQDKNRTHADIRELSYNFNSGSAQWSVGVSKVFWGVTETQHLVDIINQTDFVESGDANEKLGQPMVRWIKSTAYGKWDLFLLLGFRERTFPGIAGRLRGDFPVDTSTTERIRSSDLDFAARWSEQFERFDLGVSAFFGSSRDPALRPNAALTHIVATYDEITQIGVDAQYTLEKLSWKGEGIFRDGKGNRTIDQTFVKNPNDFYAYTLGTEYSLGSFKGTDVGVLFEYSYDSRQPKYIPNTVPVYAIFQNDYFLGMRWVLNDAYESNLFLGTAMDADSKAATITVRYNRRIRENLSLNFRSVTLTNVPDPGIDPYASVQNDSFYEINLTQYFLF